MKRILIVKLSALGDIVHLSWILPTIKSVYPDVHISWVVDDRYKKFLGLFSQVDEVIPIPLKISFQNIFSFINRFLKQILAIRKYDYDVVVDAQGLMKSGIVTAVSKSKKKIGFAKPDARENSDWFYHIKCWEAGKHINVLDKYLDLFKEIGVSNFKPKLPSLNLQKVNSYRVESFIKKIKNKYKLLLNPSASFYTKDFPINKIPILAEKIREELDSPLIVLRDTYKSQKFKEISSHPDIVLSPVFNLEELPVLFNSCDFVIGVDSGPSYIAEIVGTPSLILFGPTNLKRQSPSQAKDNHLKKVFNFNNQVYNHSIYSEYKCPIIKSGVITTPYRCVNRFCKDNLCMKEFNPSNLVRWVKSILKI